MSNMLKKAARAHVGCDNRHCVSRADANFDEYSKHAQRAKERRQWQQEARDDTQELGE